MDWPKAKTIFIVVFIILNLTLLLIIGSYKMDSGISKETLSDINKILEKRGVLVKCSIPEYRKNAPYLLFENGDVDISIIAGKLLGDSNDFDKKIKDKEMVFGSRKIVIKSDNTLEFYDSEPAENIEVMSIEQAEKHVHNFFKGLNIQVDNYALDRYSEDSEGNFTLMLIEKFKQFYVYDNFIEAYVTKQGIEKLTFGHKKIKGFSSDSMVSVMPANQVLLKNADKINNVSITNIDIGFKGFIQPGQEMQKSSEGPSWRIITEEGDCWYFKASDGEPVF